MITVAVVISCLCLVALATAASISANRHDAVNEPDPSVASDRLSGGVAAGSRPELGARLRAAREQRGLTLHEVSAATKIKAALIEGLERGDLAGWPQGMFRRAFVREYAKAIGLNPDQIAAEFTAVYAARARPSFLVERRARFRPEAPRLGLADDRPPSQDVSVRALHSVADVALVVAIAGTASLLSGASFPWMVVAVAALCYPLSLIVWGDTAAGRLHAWLAERASRRSTSEIGSSLADVATPRAARPDRPSNAAADTAGPRSDPSHAASG